MDDDLVQCIECKHFVKQITRYGLCARCDEILEGESVLLEMMKERDEQ
jgi:hypothetical protein